MARVRLTVGLFSAFLLLSVTTGCPSPGAATAHVKGKVTIGGAAVPSDANAYITFRPTGTNQAPAVAVQIKDGTYDSPDVPTGSVNVEFSIYQAGEVVSLDGIQRPEAQQKNLVPEDKAVGIPKQIDGDATLDFDL